MNLLFFYRVVVISVLAVISPLALSASARLNSNKTERQVWTLAVLPIVQDSTARRKNSENSRENQRPSEDIRDERLKEAQRRAIKEVPRSIPKLKPKPVTERINIRRPPLKVPKKGMGGSIRL